MFVMRPTITNIILGKTLLLLVCIAFYAMSAIKRFKTQYTFQHIMSHKIFAI